MTSRTRRRGAGTALTLAMVCATSGGAFAQEPREPSRAGESAEDVERTGRLQLILFVGSSPVSGAMVRVRDREASTSDNGAAWLDLPPGRIGVELWVPPEHLEGGTAKRLRIDGLQILENETSEVIVTLTTAGEVERVDKAEASGATGEKAERAKSDEPVVPVRVLRGVVLSQEGQKPVAEARVYVRGAQVDATTDAEGRFQLELPEGSYTLSVIHTKYSTQTLNDVVVRRDPDKDVVIELVPASLELEEYVVKAPHIEGGVAALIQERRQSSSVSDVLGAEEMSRTGDSDAAGALKRVTGITVVGGKYVFVRGMGERYSATLVNGLQVPSPEPERRVVPLDLFPADVLEGVVIQKTFSPDMPGEFGGGVVQLRTRSYPDQFLFGVGGSLGLNTQTTFSTGPRYNGGTLDWLGTDDGTRELPDEIREASPVKPGDPLLNPDGYTNEDLARFSRMLPNGANVYRERIPLDRGVDVTLGHRFELGNVPVGFVLTLMYDDSYQHTNIDYTSYTLGDEATGALSAGDRLRIARLERSISSGGIFVTGSEYAAGQKLKATTMLLRMTDDSTDVVTGMDDDLGVPIRRYRLRFVERQLFVQQLTGQQKIHPLASALVDWRYGYSSAFRTEPDRREYYYVSATESGEGPYHLSMRADANQRIWSELDDEVHDVGLDYTQPFKQWSGLDANVKAGAQAMVRHRDVETIRLTLSPPRPRANARVNEDVQQQSPEEIFQPDNHHGDSGWTLIDTTQPSDAYTAIQTLQAGFVMTELPLAKPLRLMGGARVEHSLQRVTTFDPWDPAGAPVVGKIDKTDVLPAVTVTYSLTDAMALRAGFGRTVSRPDFRELSQAGFRDVVRAIAYQGNPNLKRARIDNWDARWEYYFSTDELLSFGFFYKDFTNPIEQVEVPTGTERKVSYDNAAGAQNYGIELELRHRLNVLDERLESFYFATNIALIQSQIELGDAAGVATSKDRALQGQSPYVVNTQLGYDNAGEDGNGITATLLYNVFGPRISDVGRFGTPDVYEESFHQLDFVYGQKLGHGVKFGFKAKNLLNLEQIFKQGTEVSERYRRGRDFSVSLSYSY